jgi:hypothetical protein
MSRRRRLSAAVSAGSLLLALTACERPSPLVTVVSSGNSVHSEAQVYCFEGQSVQEANCATRAEQVKELRVRSGQPIGIDVDKEVAERGWLIEVGEGEQAQQSSVFRDKHYFSFGLPLERGSRVPLTVRTVGGENPQAPTGEWSFVLVGV